MSKFFDDAAIDAHAEAAEQALRACAVARKYQCPTCQRKFSGPFTCGECGDRARPINSTLQTTGDANGK